jgi:hypothetical protein
VTTLACNVPEKLDTRLEELASQAKVSKGRFVRQTLERAVGKAVSNRTAFALVSNLCGSLSGPEDLATNSKHLEGLGA